MPRLTKDDWELWNKEREAFNSTETEGFTKDLAALEAHIRQLQKLAPKDSAGWPTANALRVIDQLQRDFGRIKTLVANLRY